MPVGDDARAGEVDEVARAGPRAAQAGQQGGERGLVVRVAAVDDNVGGRGVRGEQVRAVVVAEDDVDARVGCGEGWGDVAEQDGDVVVGVGGCEGVQDGAPDVACAAGAGVGVLVKSSVRRWARRADLTGTVWVPWWVGS